MDPRLRRSQLFTAGSDAFRALRPDVIASVPGLAGGYVCPQCHRAFSRSALDPEPRLTIEHLPPKGAYDGPYSYVLVCSRCNNSAGTELDADLQAWRHAQRPQEGPQDVTFDFYGDRLNGTMEILEDGRVALLPDPTRTNPVALQRVWERLDRGEVGRFDVSGSLGFRVGRPQTALLRVAYLVAFAFLGYRYTFRDEIQLVREQIFRPDEELLPTDVVLQSRALGSERRLLWITEPWEALGVQIDDRLVLLPPPGREAVDFFDEVGETTQPMTIGMKSQPWPRIPIHPAT